MEFLNATKIFKRLSSIYIVIRDIVIERKLSHLKNEDRFSLIYHSGYWKTESKGSFSGEGSSMIATEAIRKSLPVMLKTLSIRSMLDLPCGDWHWMSAVDLSDIDYIGSDIVQDLVRHNQQKYGSPARRFVRLDLISDELPCCDLIFVRDCLVHLDNIQIHEAIRNIIASGSTYLATTIFNNVTQNIESNVVDGWRPLNLMLPPFNFPQPIDMLDDRSSINLNDTWKYMGVFRVDDLAKCYC